MLPTLLIATLLLGAPVPEPAAFTPPAQVKELLAYRDWPEARARTALGPPEEHVGYEGLRDVARYGPKGSKLYLFFRDHTLRVVYSGDDAFLARLTRASIERELGPPERTVRSRQGKRANQHLYPGRGFAYSEEDGQVGFVEVFPPMTLQAYLRDLYVDPGRFIR